MSPSGSGRSLIEKLGIKEGVRIVILNPPRNYCKTLGRLPAGTAMLNKPEGDFIHLFTKTKKEIETDFPRLKDYLSPDGAFWVSWPKRTLEIETDLDEGIVRMTGRENGLVDVKVCAIDETWSALKFVYRVKDRSKRGKAGT